MSNKIDKNLRNYPPHFSAPKKFSPFEYWFVIFSPIRMEELLFPEPGSPEINIKLYNSFFFTIYCIINY